MSENGWVRIDPDDHEISVSGEWGDDDLTVSQFAVIGSSDRSLAIIVCDMNAPNEWDDARVEHAVALVTAAPELFEALEAAEIHFARFARTKFQHEAVGKIRAALAKAREGAGS